MKMETEIGNLVVSGTTLYYEKRGSGPLLLLIHGGNGDADSFPIVEELAKQYTVVTYDRRGHRRSKLVDRNESYQIEQHSEDASRLLSHLTNQPAYVFGCSSGAVIALDLAMRYPEKIQLLIAHEPPLPTLLSGEEQRRATDSLTALHKKYAVDGPAAMAAFAKAMGITVTKQPERPKRVAEQKGKDVDYFILKEVPALQTFCLDKDKLRSMPIISAAGIASKGHLPYRFSEALAKQLGISVTHFPGNHVGCVTHPHEFAKKLMEVITYYRK